MKIAVCIKQVPAGQEARMDPEKGVLIRSGAAASMNPYDYFAVEAALKMREEAGEGSTVTAFTMGPPSAEAVLREAYGMGVDEAVLISDGAFAGADVLATSRTVSQALRAKGPFDLIFCGRQTTDGDTAQVGPSIAAHMGLPYASWVTQIVSLQSDAITVEQQLTDISYQVQLPMPCLLSVERDIYQPRLPSLKLKMAARKKELAQLHLADMPEQTPELYGQKGSPTRVKRVFRPEQDAKSQPLQGDIDAVASQLAEMLSKWVK